MTPCKQLGKSYTDYVCDLLDDHQATVIEAHLQACPTCAREVQSLRKVWSLADEAGQVPIPGVILDNIEMKVYKRLAAESPLSERMPVFSRLLALFPRSEFNWLWRGALATLALAIGIPLATIVFDPDTPPDVAPMISVQTPRDRIEQYRQSQEIEFVQEALETKHLTGDEDRATMQLRYVALVQHNTHQPIK